MNWRRWRLNAPPDYNWKDDDVIHEKNESLLNGIIIGWLAGTAVTYLLAVMM